VISVSAAPTLSGASAARRDEEKPCDAKPIRIAVSKTSRKVTMSRSIMRLC
jgi:hypothetical protein